MAGLHFSGPSRSILRGYRIWLSVAIGNGLVGDLVVRAGRFIALLAEKMLMALQTTAARYCAASKPFREIFLTEIA